jgi:hypothetical protein
MYLVGVCDIDDCYTCFYIQVYKKSKVSAAAERQRLIRNAYHGAKIKKKGPVIKNYCPL